MSNASINDISSTVGKEVETSIIADIARLKAGDPTFSGADCRKHINQRLREKDILSAYEVVPPAYSRKLYELAVKVEYGVVAPQSSLSTMIENMKSLEISYKLREVDRVCRQVTWVDPVVSDNVRYDILMVDDTFKVAQENSGFRNLSFFTSIDANRCMTPLNFKPRACIQAPSAAHCFSPKGLSWS